MTISKTKISYPIIAAAAVIAIAIEAVVASSNFSRAVLIEITSSK